MSFTEMLQINQQAKSVLILRGLSAYAIAVPFVNYF